MNYLLILLINEYSFANHCSITFREILKSLDEQSEASTNYKQLIETTKFKERIKEFPIEVENRFLNIVERYLSKQPMSLGEINKIKINHSNSLIELKITYENSVFQIIGTESNGVLVLLNAIKNPL